MECKAKAICSSTRRNQMAIGFIQNSLRIPWPSASLTKLRREKLMNNKESAIRALYFIYLHSILFFNFSGWKFFRRAHGSRVFQNFTHKIIKLSLMTTSKRLWPQYEKLRSRVAIGDQKDSLDYHQQCLATTFRRGSKESSSSCFAPWGSILVLRSWRQASQQWVGVPKCLENWVERKCLAKFRKSNFGIFVFGVWLQASQEWGVFTKFY